MRVSRDFSWSISCNFARFTRRRQASRDNASGSTTRRFRSSGILRLRKYAQRRSDRLPPSVCLSLSLSLFLRFAREQLIHRALLRRGINRWRIRGLYHNAVIIPVTFHLATEHNGATRNSGKTRLLLSRDYALICFPRFRDRLPARGIHQDLSQLTYRPAESRNTDPVHSRIPASLARPALNARGRIATLKLESRRGTLIIYRPNSTIHRRGRQSARK